MIDQNKNGATPAPLNPSLNQSSEPEEIRAYLMSLADRAPGALEMEVALKEVANQTGHSLSTLRSELKLLMQSRDTSSGSELEFEEPEQWPDPVDGEALLDDILKFISRFVVAPEEALVAVATWCAVTWLLDSFGVAPRLAITAPDKRCGKTVLLTLVGWLSRRALPCSNVSMAVVYRAIDKWRPTLLIDEADTFMGGRTDGLTGICNSGHTRANAFVLRCMGDDWEPKKFSTWAPIAIARIGALTDTLADRSIRVSLRRRRAGEEVESVSAGQQPLEVPILRSRLARWCFDHAAEVSLLRPSTPSEIVSDRDRDNFGPLIAIGQAAGLRWEKRIRDAAGKLCAGAEDTESEPMLFLHDLARLFEQFGADRLLTDKILKELNEMDDRPWPESSGGRPMSGRKIATMLKPFGIKPRKWDGGKRGYVRADFREAFELYLPEESAPVATPATESETSSQSVSSPESPTLGGGSDGGLGALGGSSGRGNE